MADWDERFRIWAKPPSDTETQRIENTERAIKQAINKSAALSKRNTSIFVQGSYRNRVNVRQESDVDIGILCTNTFFYGKLPPPLTRESLNIADSTYSYDEFWSDVYGALNSHFGDGTVEPGGKAFNIKSNTYRVDADVAAFFEHRRYSANGTYISGVEMRPPKYENGIINWPEQHYDNGVQKNTNTQRRYKSLVRILKKVMYMMEADGIKSALETPGFLLECLVWNVPNNLTGKASITDDVRDCLVYLFENTSNPDSCSDWREVSELKYLFGANNQWSALGVNIFVKDAWNYLGFS